MLLSSHCVLWWNCCTYSPILGLCMTCFTLAEATFFSLRTTFVLPSRVAVGVHHHVQGFCIPPPNRAPPRIDMIQRLPYCIWSSVTYPTHTSSHTFSDNFVEKRKLHSLPDRSCRSRRPPYSSQSTLLSPLLLNLNSRLTILVSPPSVLSTTARLHDQLTKPKQKKTQLTCSAILLHFVLCGTSLLW